MQGMLSRLRCCVHELLKAENKDAATQMFRALKNPEFLEDLKLLSDCLKGTLFKALLEEYGDQLKDGRGYHVRLFLAIFLMSDTVDIERRHASIRRE